MSDRREVLLSSGGAQPASAPILPAVQEKASKPMSKVSLALLITLCLWNAICGGTLYMWATLEKDLQDHCNWNAADTNIVYASGQIAVGVGFVPGILFNRYGSRSALVYAILFFLSGGALWYWSLNANPSAAGKGGDASVCSAPYAMSGFYFLTMSGSTSLYQTGLFTALNMVNDAHANWRAEDRPRWLSIGFVAGLVSAGYGLSGAVWSAVYNSLTPGEGQLKTWIIITAVTWTVTAVTGMFALPSQRLTGKQAEETRRIRRESESRMALTDPESQLAPASADQGTQKQEQSKQMFEGDWKAALRTPAYWSILLQFVILNCIGSGFMIGNLTYLTGSFKYDKSTQHMAVEIVSYANCGGRLLCGILMDTAGSSIRKDRWFLLTGLITLLGCLSVQQGVSLDLLPFILVGLAYGGNWAVMPAAIADEFGKQNTMFGFCTCAFFMSGAVKGISVLTAHFYDLHKSAWEKANPDYTKDTFCHPVKTCFQEVSWVAMGLCGFSLVLGTLLMFVLGRGKNSGRGGKGDINKPAHSTASLQDGDRQMTAVAPASTATADQRDGLVQYPSIPSVEEPAPYQGTAMKHGQQFNVGGTVTPATRPGTPA